MEPEDVKRLALRQELLKAIMSAPQEQLEAIKKIFLFQLFLEKKQNQKGEIKE